ncbi:hypothetical protein GF325_11315 [Candidatus Bathyarchaeota archaeon]|nr:hypothetical protein [Candidatus Bathyarchaeota archaeon]
MDSDNRILSSRRGRLQLITLNRPEKANSLTPSMLEQLKKSLLHAQQDDKVRVVVITGTGDNFTTGMDVNSLSNGYSPEQRETMSKRMERLGAETASVIYHGKPTISAINGRCMGMGVVYALASDFRIAVDSATFKMPELDHSLYPGANCVMLMVQQLGILKTKEILMTCRTYSAREFLACGLLNEMHPLEVFMDHVMDLGKQLGRKNQDVLRFLKMHANHVPFLASYQEGSALEQAMFQAMFERDKEAYKQQAGKRFGIDSAAYQPWGGLF